MDHSLAKESRLSIGWILEQAAFAAMLVLAAVFAFEHTQPLIDLGPVVLSNVETIITLLIILWLLARLLNDRPFEFPRRLGLPLLLWLLVLAISAVMAPAFQDKIFLFMGRMLAGIVIGAAAFDLANTPVRRWMLVGAMATGGLLVAVLGLAEAFGGDPIVGWLDGFKYAPTRVGDLLRVSATLSYATIMAMVLEMVLPLLVVLALVVKRPLIRGFWLVGMVLILAAHVLTLSRAGTAALIIVLVLMAVAGWRRNQRNLTTLASAAALLSAGLAAVVLLINPTARLRLTSETEQAWYQAAYEGPETIRAEQGQIVSVPIEVTNAGQRSWSPKGELFFSLSYHLTNAGGESINYDGERSQLPGDVSPGSTVTVQGVVRAPEEPGRYLVEWDMVQEAVAWFSWKESATFTSALIVTEGQSTTGTVTPSSESVPPSDIRVRVPTPGRSQLWRTALLMTADRPLFGVGPDNFRWQYGAYAEVEEWDTGIHANNLYLEWLADTGIIGLLAFLWFSWRLLEMSLANLGQGNGRPWLLALGLAAGLAAWYLHGFFDYFFEFTPTYVLFWILVGLMASQFNSEGGGDARRI